MPLSPLGVVEPSILYSIGLHTRDGTDRLGAAAATLLDPPGNADRCLRGIKRDAGSLRPLGWLHARDAQPAAKDSLGAPRPSVDVGEEKCSFTGNVEFYRREV